MLKLVRIEEVRHVAQMAKAARVPRDIMLSEVERDIRPGRQPEHSLVPRRHARRRCGAPGWGIYAAAKAAVRSLTRAMATEFAPDGIRANTIAPGLILTRFNAKTPKERLDSVAAAVPLRRLGTAEDCVGACLFLASPRMSGYVTGRIIDINGGRLMP